MFFVGSLRPESPGGAYHPATCLQMSRTMVTDAVWIQMKASLAFDKSGFFFSSLHPQSPWVFWVLTLSFCFFWLRQSFAICTLTLVTPLEGVLTIVNCSVQFCFTWFSCTFVIKTATRPDLSHTQGDLDNHHHEARIDCRACGGLCLVCAAGCSDRLGRPANLPKPRQHQQ